MDRIREFAPEDTAGAVTFLGEIRGVYDEVSIEEEDGTSWRLVYAGPLEPALELLRQPGAGMRFRLRAVNTHSKPAE